MHRIETLPTHEPKSQLVDHMYDGVLTTMWAWMSYWTWRTRLIQIMLVFVLRIFHFWLIQMDTRITDTLESCITLFSYHPRESSPSTRSVTPATSMKTSHVNLEENNSWWPWMTGRVTCLSVMVWPAYLSYTLMMKRWSHIPRRALLHLESGSHRI